MELTIKSIFFPSVMLYMYILTFFSFFVSCLSNPSVDDSVAVSPDQDDKQDGEKTEKYKKKVNKAAKPKYEAKGHSTYHLMNDNMRPLLSAH